MVTSHFQMTFSATHLVSFNTDWKIEWGPQLKNYFCKNLSRPFLVCDVFLRRMRIRGSFGVDFFSKHSKWSLKFKLVTGTNSQPLADFCLFWMRGILRIQPNSSRNSCRTASTKVGQFKRHCCRVLVVRQGPRKDLKCCLEGFEDLNDNAQRDIVRDSDAQCCEITRQEFEMCCMVLLEGGFGPPYQSFIMHFSFGLCWIVELGSQISSLWPLVPPVVGWCHFPK